MPSSRDSKSVGAGRSGRCSPRSRLGRPYEIVAPRHHPGRGIALVAWIVVQDLRTYTIADGAVVALSPCSPLAVASSRPHDPALLDRARRGPDSGGVLLAFREIYYRRRGVDGLGLGDVKLAAAGGLLVGAQTFAWALLAASLVGARRRRRSSSDDARTRGAGRPQKLAFGAVLAPAIYVAWLVTGAAVPAGTREPCRASATRRSTHPAGRPAA